MDPNQNRGDDDRSPARMVSRRPRRNARLSSMDRVQEALRMVSRADFVVPQFREQADVDAPLPIGFGQTISQPTTVRLMVSWLDPMPGDVVLDVGSGSGWTTALLAHIVGPQGTVYAVERIPELVTFGRDNCRRLGFENALFFQAGQEYGLREHAPYSRILVSASAGTSSRIAGPVGDSSQVGHSRGVRHPRGHTGRRGRVPDKNASRIRVRSAGLTIPVAPGC